MRTASLEIALAALWALAAPALAGPPEFESGPDLGGDTLEIRQGPVWPQVYYKNSGAEQSREGVHKRTVAGVEIRIEIGVTAAHEIITVTPLDPMVRAEPSTAEVEDGASISIDIILPLF